MRKYILPFLLVLFFTSCTEKLGSENTKIEKIVILGNGFSERIKLYNFFEAALHLHSSPNKLLAIRNMSYSGDEVNIMRRTANFGSLQDHLNWYQPRKAFLFYGMNESFRGHSKQELKNWENNLTSFIKSLDKSYDKEKKSLELVLISPIAQEDTGPVKGKKLVERNKSLKDYTEIMKKVAKQFKIPFVDLFAPSYEYMQSGKSQQRPLTSNGIHQTEFGAFFFAEQISKSLGWIDEDKGSEKISAKEKKALLTLLYEKNYYYKFTWDPTNQVHLWGHRYKAWQEDKPLYELEQIYQKVEEIDKEIFDFRIQKNFSLKSFFSHPPKQSKNEFWESIVVDRKNFAKKSYPRIEIRRHNQDVPKANAQ